MTQFASFFVYPPHHIVHHNPQPKDKSLFGGETNVWQHNEIRRIE